MSKFDWIWDIDDLPTPLCKSVLAAVGWFEEHGVDVPQIVTMTCCGRRTVLKYLKVLEARELVKEIEPGVWIARKP